MLELYNDNRSASSLSLDFTDNACSEQSDTPTPVPLEVILDEDVDVREISVSAAGTGDRGSSCSSLIEAQDQPLPLCRSNPFWGFGDRLAEFSATDRKTLIEIHPVQPQSTPGKKVHLPFNPLKAYYRDDNENRKWLCYSESSRHLFCWVCVGFRQNRTCSSAFTVGFGGESAWKSGHCYQAILRHELSSDHLHSVESYHLFAKEISVNQLIDTTSLSLRKKQVTARREAVLRIIDIVLFLAKQSLPFRSKNKEAAYALTTSCNHGNFLEEVKSRATYDPILRNHLETVMRESEKRHAANPSSRGRGSLVTFLSKSTFEKILDITANLILKYIRDQVIQNGGTYSITLDGCQDVSVQEVMAFVIRYVNEFGPVESLVDVSIMKSTTSKALLDYTVDVLEKKLGLVLKDLKGYSFDGAGNMAGSTSGLQALLKQLVPLSVFQHCYAHILSLSLEKTCSAILYAVSFFDLLRDTCTIISESYKRSALWKSVSSFICNKTKMLVKLGKTRWWAKARACSRIFTNNEDSLLPVIIVALEIISRDKDLPGKSRAKALGDLGKWLSFEILAVGVLFNSIFQHTGPVSDYLQTPQLDHVQAARLTSQLIPDVSAISIDDVLLNATKLVENCNEKLDDLNSNEEFTNVFGEIDSVVPLQAVGARKRISKVPCRLGERSGKYFFKQQTSMYNVCFSLRTLHYTIPYSVFSDDEMRRLAEENSPNWYLRVNALIPIKDHCVSNLRDRFEEEKLVIFKSCAFLSPERFEEIVRDGIPNGALNDLCELAGIDSAVVASELLSFAKCYERLKDSIQVDFPPTVDLQEFDVDFEVSVHPSSYSIFHICTSSPFLSSANK